MKDHELQEHMFATYTHLRIGVAIISFAFPLLLWGGGAMLGIPLPESMSAYYHVAENGDSMRNWFVGILFAVGVILYLYKGYSHQENRALNIAGIFAICVAVFPKEWDCGQECMKISIHGISAVLFFLSLIYVSVFRASDTLHLIKDEVRRRRFRNLYWLTGLGMLLFPLIALLLAQRLDRSDSFIFFAEAVGIWFFSSYWLLKSWEISDTNAEHLALKNEIET